MARKKRKKKTTSAKRTGSGRGAARGLAGVSTEQLQTEIERRVREIQARREELEAELQTIEHEVARLDGGISLTAASDGRGRATRKKAGERGQPRANGRRGRPRGRGRNKGSLVEALAGVLKGRKAMGVGELAEGVQESGYKSKSKSKNFRLVVNQALLRHPERFKKIGRGQYAGA